MKNILAIIFIAASVGLFYTYIDGTYRRTQDLQIEREEYDEALNNSKKVKELRTELLAKYRNFQEANLARLEKLLPNNVDTIRLVIEIDRVAGRYNMILRNVSISKTETDPNARNRSGALAVENVPYGTATLGFSVTGNYNEFLSFISDLEKSLRIIDVIGIRFKATDPDPEEVFVEEQYEYDVSINTYWLKSQSS